MHQTRPLVQFIAAYSHLVSSIAKLLSETKQINLKKMKVMVYKHSDTVKHLSPERMAKRAVEKKS